MNKITLPSLDDALKQTQPNTKLCDLKWGGRFWLNAGEKNWFYQRQLLSSVPYQNRFTVRFLGMMRNPKHLIDIGANVGMMSVAYAKVAEKVSAFEPTPRTAELCAKNLVINEATNVDLYQLALSNNSGTCEFADHHEHDGINQLVDPARANATASKAILTVNTARLDDFGFEVVNGIKIDVEGAEMLVLEGAKDTIERCRPIVQTEIMEDHLRAFKRTPQDVFDWFLARRYVPFGSQLQQLGRVWRYRRHECDVFWVPAEKA